MADETYDRKELELFVRNVWNLYFAIDPKDNLKSMTNFLDKLKESFENGSPEEICISGHKDALNSINFSTSKIDDLRHLGKSLLENICQDLLFDGDSSDYSGSESE